MGIRQYLTGPVGTLGMIDPEMPDWSVEEMAIAVRDALEVDLQRAREAIWAAVR